MNKNICTKVVIKYSMLGAVKFKQTLKTNHSIFLESIHLIQRSEKKNENTFTCQGTKTKTAANAIKRLCLNVRFFLLKMKKGSIFQSLSLQSDRPCC